MVCSGGACEAGIVAAAAALGLSTPAGQQAAQNTANALSQALSSSEEDSNATCKPAIADVQPGDLCEQLALAEAKAGAGRPIMFQLVDEPRLVAHYGLGPWVKMQHTHICPNGRKLVIHYFSNMRGLNVELKFVN
jgi:hypothetical protein